jgi:hypothetical protein
VCCVCLKFACVRVSFKYIDCVVVCVCVVACSPL